VILPQSFYDRPADQVAPELLGRILVSERAGVRVAGRIVEAEAYLSEDDPSCHASVGRTQRNDPMFGPPGRAYVYFTYGMHWLLNAVCAAEGVPEAALIRALEPLEGLEAMAERRGRSRPHDLCSGPAKLTQALGIEPEDNRRDLTAGETLWIEEGAPVSGEAMAAGPRIGVGGDQRPLRYAVPGSQWLSARI
jgi:DNA-3-methyladenine glycosylase